MNKNKLIKGGGVVIAITLLITFYFAFVGYSSNKAGAKTILNTSQEISRRWQMASAALGVELNATKAGDLSPVIGAKYSALDLVIYGEEIVAEKYKNSYKAMQIPSMVGKVFIKTIENELVYSVSGYRLISIEYDKESNKIASFYANVPRTVVDSTNKFIDGSGITENGDNIGAIRYAKLENGKYILGVFIDPVEI